MHFPNEQEFVSESTRVNAGKNRGHCFAPLPRVMQYLLKPAGGKNNMECNKDKSSF